MRQLSMVSVSAFALLTGFNLLVGASIGVNQVQAAEKSAISPDIVIPSTDLAPANNPEPAAPVIETAPPVSIESAPEPQVNIQTPEEVYSAPAVASPASPPPNSASISAPDIVVHPRQSGSSRSRNSATSNTGAPEQIHVVLENRSSGCRASASDLNNLQSNLCTPRPRAVATASYNYIYRNPQTGFSAGFSAEIKPYSGSQWRGTGKVPSVKLPSNGDKWLQFPLAIPAYISSTFGDRIHPITGVAKFHQGTDIAAPEGTPVLAAYSGTVEISGWMGGLGLAVVVSHGDTHETRYGHMMEIFVQPGQKVKQGTPIGLVGSTGFSTGPHLHFELWQKQGDDWVVVDPTPQLIAALDRLEFYLAQVIKPVISKL